MAFSASQVMPASLESLLGWLRRYGMRRFCWLSCAFPLLWVSQTQALAQTQNEDVLGNWAAQTGERVQVDRDENGTVSWRLSAVVDVYRREVESPGELDLLTANQNGNIHSATVSADWRSGQEGQPGSHFYFSNSHSSDRAVHARYRNQITSLQAGVSRPGGRVVVGDVVANHSILGTSTGLRGTALRWRAGRHTVEAFGGVVADSWATLVGTTPRTDAPAGPDGRRHVHGAKISTPLSERMTAFATVQAFDDRVNEAADSVYADSLPQQVFNGQSSTLGLAYERSFSGGQVIGFDAEYGGSRADALTPGDRRSDRAYSVGGRAEVPWSGGHYLLGMGKHDLGMDWAGIGAAAVAGSRESYVSNSVQIGEAWSWRHDWLDSLNRLPWGEDIYEAAQATSTHQLAWQPVWMDGGSLALYDIRTRTEDNADANARIHQTQASVSLVRGDWQGALQWALAAERVYGASGQSARLRDWQLSVGHNGRDLPRNRLQLGSYTVNVSAGRKTHVTAVDNRLQVRSVRVDLSGVSPTWGSLSLSHGRQWVRLAFGDNEVPTRSTTLDYSKTFRSGLSLRVYLSDLDQNAGLPYAQLNERTVGIQLSQTLP